MDLGLKDRRAIVTGGSQGIGRACALALAREGVRVCIVARTQEKLDAVVAEINEAGGEGHSVSVDLTRQESCEQVVKETVEAFGGVDILVNNVGAAKNADILELNVEQISEALQLKSYSYLRMAQLVIPHMKENGWGRIVNIAGGAGTSPTRTNIPTGAANITILNMTRALSDAVSGDGILVNTVCPGLTNTPRARTQQGARAEREGRDVEEVLKELGSELPAGRMAEPEEIANVATFLASEACSYIFGSSIYMDGGVRRSTP
ncbi:MAG: SDR family oxidoreductase [Candidatus Latescibacteria bacterium]|nr:SDR family oxidoreductase [Candidatus Latescibacterota bacterium]